MVDGFGGAAVARIDRIWTGIAGPIYVEVDGTPYQPEVSDPYLPMHLWLAAWCAQLATDSGSTLSATYTYVPGSELTVTIGGMHAVDWTLSAGFAVWIDGDASQPANVTMTATGGDISITPARWGIAAHRYPRTRTVAHGEGICWAPMRHHVVVQRTITARDTADAWEPLREPHVLYRDDDTEWSWSNLDGWLCVRPLDTDPQRKPVGGGVTTGIWEYVGEIV
jgi:hypothetical protein